MSREAEKRGASPDSLAHEIPSPKRIELCPPLDARIKESCEDVSMEEEVNVLMEEEVNVLMEEEVNDSVINNMCEPMQTEKATTGNDFDYVSSTSVDSKAEPDVVTGCTEVIESYAFREARIEHIIKLNGVKEIADKLIQHKEIVQILEDFLRTLAPGSKDAVTNRALHYFDKVKNVWENQHFVGVLRTVTYHLPYMNSYARVSRRRLSEFIVRKIKSDSSFNDILDFENQDRVTMMRDGLSVLIGYWSNEAMIHRMLSMGGHSLRTLLKGEDIIACGKVRRENKIWRESSTPTELIPFYSPIKDLRQDSSIEELANRLLNIPNAVTLVERFLRSLRDEAPLETYYMRHVAAAICFWFDPLIIEELIKSLKKSMPLANVFKKYSEGAQLLRCVERITCIQKDPLLDSIFVADLDWKMRGALSILFGYSTDTDVYEFYRSILASGFGLNKDDKLEVFEYLAYGPDDVEGLKSALAEKYFEDTKEYRVLLEEIKQLKYPRISKRMARRMTEEMKEKIAMEAVIELALLKVMLRNGEIILYEVTPLIPFAKSYTRRLK